MKKIILLSLTISSLGFSAGFEQLLMWSGKNVGQASAVTSTISGAEALYFNPAGLITDSKNDLSFNLSYLRSKFKAPLTTPNDSKDSKAGNNFTASVLYSRQISDQLAWGVGIFPSAGLEINYDDITGVNAAPKVNLRVYELSGGVAYKALPELTFGLAYRITYSTADFTAIAPGPTIIKFENMKGWDFFSFRGGAQYKKDNWGLGLSFRTPVKVKVKGDLTATGGLNGTDSGSTISTTFPLEITLGGNYKPTPNLTLLLDYSFLNYKAADKLDTNTSVAGVPDVELQWKNAHVIRIAGDYLLNKTHIRAGYILVTQIVNKDHAMSTSEPPGVGHLFTLGSGVALNEALELNGALFYGFASGKADGALAGDYKVTGYGLHTGLDWKF